MPPKRREPQPPTPAQGGPYLGAAFLCEKVLRDADGVQSYIRVVDRITVNAVGADPPDEMPPANLDLTAALMFKSGDARGSYAVKLRPEGPDGLWRAAVEVRLMFEGDGDRGHNVNVDLKGLELDQAGLWWFDVLFGPEEALMSRIPLRLVYLPRRVVSSGGGDEQS